TFYNQTEASRAANVVSSLGIQLAVVRTSRGNFRLTVGLRFRKDVIEDLAIGGMLEAGYGMLATGGADPKIDWSVGLARARLCLHQKMWRELWLEACAGSSFYLLTLDGKEALRLRPDGQGIRRRAEKSIRSVGPAIRGTVGPFEGVMQQPPLEGKPAFIDAFTRLG
ncbi:unnamed protein product, partial [marine sediment metagenome]